MATTDYARLEHSLVDGLRLSRRPVAIAFRQTAPDGVARLSGSQPSGCSFWRLAGEGRVFYTEPADHYNCPIGSYTHNIPLPPEREQELPQALSLMTGVGYIRMEEVPAVPRLPFTPAITVYAPLGETPVAPDVVVISGAPGAVMLLQEAALRADRQTMPLLGRPTCMAVPASLGGKVVSSLGCIGNRIYTGVTDADLYTMIAGADLQALVDQLPTIAAANAALTAYHQDRRAALSTM